MNNSIEIIGIDHGWSQMKTSNYCFNTSIKELPNVPAFTDNVLQYDNRHFAVGDEHDPLGGSIPPEMQATVNPDPSRSIAPVHAHAVHGTYQSVPFGKAALLVHRISVEQTNVLLNPFRHLKQKSQGVLPLAEAILLNIVEVQLV